MNDLENAAAVHPETFTLILRKPIQMKGDTVAYSQLELREPNVDELDRSLKAGETSYATNSALIAFITGIPVQAVRTLGKRDYEEAVTYLQGF
ncbi:phage tail assembly protein [Burkholderia vietnamiensis]|uniref:phage tail assembly protein n=1 Tax=Burkholderia vietnamiensis TaxID=60552 RepID=UPI001D137537|nr:phage tail assembly protein [Burkholderia vietnamiensis]UEC03972.1 phage tail assembly protein [Burkholderia vietnamiensis]